MSLVPGRVTVCGITGASTTKASKQGARCRSVGRQSSWDHAAPRRLGLSRNWTLAMSSFKALAAIRSQTLCTDGVSVLVSFSGSKELGPLFCSTNVGAVAWRLVGE
jgi:hypothetical protein